MLKWNQTIEFCKLKSWQTDLNKDLIIACTGTYQERFHGYTQEQSIHIINDCLIKPSMDRWRNIAGVYWWKTTQISLVHWYIALVPLWYSLIVTQSKNKCTLMPLCISEILCTVKIMNFITLVKNFFVIHSDGGLSIFCLGFCAGQCPGRAEFICNSLTES